MEETYKLLKDLINNVTINIEDYYLVSVGKYDLILQGNISATTIARIKKNMPYIEFKVEDTGFLKGTGKRDEEGIEIVINLT